MLGKQAKEAAPQPEQSTPFMKIITSFMYAFSSIGIMMVNKQLLTVMGFPCVVALALFQSIATIACLQLGSVIGWTPLPAFEWRSIWLLQPLPIVFVLNVFFGLAGSKGLSIPMFTVLRRFTMLMTLIGECVLLGDRQGWGIVICVLMMLGGALLAAVNDLAFDLTSYGYIMGNNLCTALYGVIMKGKLNAKALGPNGLVCINSLCSIPILLLALFCFPEATKFDQLDSWDWYDPRNNFFLVVSSIFGFFLNMAIMLCTKHNSALTVSVIGSLKNIVTTFWGMVFAGDYVFSMSNFTGILISLSGSLAYAYLTITSSGENLRRTRLFFLFLFALTGLMSFYMVTTLVQSSPSGTSMPRQTLPPNHTHEEH